MSPIKGLTEQRRMPRLGKIHLGIKVQKIDPVTKKPCLNAKKEEIWYPKATDYFVCPPEVRAVFGDQPTELDIVFPVEDETQFAPQFYKCYNQSFGLACKGTGIEATERFDLSNGRPANKDSKETSWRLIECKGQECPTYKAGDCSEMMNLQFFIPKAPGFGVYQMDTGSYFGIVEINSGIDLIRQICGGRIAGIPLKLAIVQRDVTPKGMKKKRINVLKLSSSISLEDIQRIAARPVSQCFLPKPDESEMPLRLNATSPEDALFEKAAASRDVEPPSDEDIAALWDMPTGTGTVEPTVIEATAVEIPTARESRQSAPVKTRKLDSIQDLWNACYEDFGLKPKDVLNILKVDSPTSLTEAPGDLYMEVATEVAKTKK